MTLAPGTTLGPYEVLAPLGKGGMGEVYRAHDTRLARDVAIKVLPSEVASDADRVRRFEREARAASALNHPNIITIYEVGRYDERAYIAMELVDGVTLKSLLDAGPVPTEKLVRYASQIAEGLAKAHGAGIVHRDLKPANIIINTDDYIKILDFGLAKLRALKQDLSSESPTVKNDETAPGAILGTLAYMSPEQARGESVDFRSDQFALGAILHEMATGKPAFKQNTPAETLSSILRDQPAPLNQAPGGVTSVVRRCLAKDPGKRYGATSEILDELEATSTTPVSTARSIAVLPFKNLSPDADNEYFSDGLTEEIITDLSRVRAMKVLSQASAMRLKGSEKNLQTLAGELGVEYILQGSVRKAGNQLRVTAQLVDARADEHLWAEKYSGTLDDVFEIQETLSRTIVDALKVQLTPDEDRRIAEKPIADVRAYDCYLRARHEYSQATEEGAGAALRYLDEGLEIVGPNSLLFAAKGWAFFNMAIADTFRHHEYLRRARECAEKIFELEPDSARAHALLGVVMADYGDPVEGIGHMERALELDPTDLDNLSMLAIFNAFVGRSERSLRQADLLLERDPLNPFTQWAAAWSRQTTNRLEEAQGFIEKAHTMDPDNPIYRTAYAQILAARGQENEALEVLSPIEHVSPNHAWAILGLILKRVLEKDVEGVAAVVNQHVDEAFRNDHTYAYLLAERYAHLGERVSALKWLAIAIDGGFWNANFMQTSPLLANLRDDPELTRLIELAREKSKQFDSE